MKIGFDAKRAFHNSTGLGHYSRDTIRLIAKSFPEATCFVFNPKSAPTPEALKSANILIVKPEGAFEKISGSLWRRYGITRVVKPLGLDLYHGLSAELPVNIEKTGVRTVVTIHDLIFERYPQFYSRVDLSFYRNKTHHAAMIADHILAVSLQTKMDLINFYKIPEEKIQVLYQGFHPIYNTLPDAHVLEQVQRQHQLQAPFCLFVGTIEARKNLLTVLKAIQPLPDVHLVAVGRSTPYTKEVVHYAHANGLSNRLKILENIDLKTLHAIYHLARIFVYPSIIEGFGIPLVEAQACGLPIISSKGGCFAEAGGPHSLYLEYGEVSDWSDAIKGLWNDETQQRTMKAKGLTNAARFNESAIGGALADAYRQILNP
jgi:glycosyltransferase involved in cell wall biosynthesis